MLYNIYIYIYVCNCNDVTCTHISQRIFLSLPWCHLKAMRISWDILIRGGFPPGTASVAKHPVQSTNNTHIQTSKTIMKNHELS